ncbi:conserved membrane hypothetical protein [Phycicoccus elongatus Lp2]|uniref:GDT1 family protein n=1 Tax=Phycicoccus elongatus Lp2 TaxID=1193181 RepID=N0E1Z8_9MICO|nr:TMEM165/GDT1 family protein [Phycicoccus elongatus]CCH70917.1 conserved membrane hypothetical protein [Phycicoccus elongatus Lp2]
MLDLTTMALVFGAIFLVELPDKTFIATLVMSTRFRPLLVWIGVGLAFLVQTLVAVVAGGLLAKLPTTPVQLVAIAMFLIGGLILLKGAAGADAEEAETEEEFAEKSNRQVRGWQIVSMCFGIIFLAEWGDLSQLLTASMVLKYGEPVSVFLGAWAALLAVSALGAALGRTLLTKMKLSTIRRIGGVVCLVLALVGILEFTGLFGG